LVGRFWFSFFKEKGEEEKKERIKNCHHTILICLIMNLCCSRFRFSF